MKSGFKLRHILSTLLITILLVNVSFDSYGQKRRRLQLSGRVTGYHFKISNGLFKKTKGIEMEGTLSGVRVVISENGKLIQSVFTSKNGVFNLEFRFNHQYKLSVYKAGYDAEEVFVDTRKFPEKLEKRGVLFEDVEFMLRSYLTEEDAKELPYIGKFYFNENLGYISFSPNKERSAIKGLFRKNNNIDNSVELLSRAVVKNRNRNPVDGRGSSRRFSTKSNLSLLENELTDQFDSTSVEINQEEKTLTSEFKIRPTKSIREITEDEIEGRKSELVSARKQLEIDKENAITEEDFRILAERENIILSAEKELETARVLIESQQSQIKLQGKLLSAFIWFLVFGVLFLGVILYFFWQRKKTNKVLAVKNKNITDSIQYAEKIQRSFLRKENEIDGLFDESFILFKPRDIVSGDFYWFDEINGKSIVAAIDCTGHGVPGAFVSSMGNSLMNQIIHEKGILNPGEILELLHKGIFKILNQDKDEDHAQDGMDLSICVFDKKIMSVDFAGAFNPAYLVRDGEVEVIKADYKSVGGKSMRPGKDDSQRTFSTKSIKLKKGDSIYQLTDGYMDQFGGENSEKFNSKRFKEALIRFQNLPMKSQKELFLEEFVTWKNEHKQIDDVLLIGIKVS